MILRSLLIVGLCGSLWGYAPVSATPLSQEAVTPDAVTRSIPISGMQAVSAGELHSCALTTAGAVMCWGNNDYGQLGNGTLTSSTTPVQVTGLVSDVIAISIGIIHSCALTGDGGVQCWGDNSAGQLGNGTFIDSSTPVAVTDLDSGVSAISSDAHHTCALTSGGAVKCWGYNGDGQLGDGTFTSSNIPVAVMGLSSGVSAISSGAYHSCALTTGVMKCWGNNGDGQLGDGTTTSSSTPVAVTGLVSGITAISGGYYHTCVLTTGGGVQCWGFNGNGQLGNGSTTDSTSPVNVSGLGRDVMAISGGGYHTCAVTSGGAMKCWGNNFLGQLGNGSRDDSLTPVDVVGLGNGVDAINSGYFYTCAVTSSGGIKCWGHNFTGQLGDTTHLLRSLPSDVLTLATCYALTRNHSGDGADPSATPDHSQGCPANHYLPGTAVAVVATPGAGHYVQGWTGTNNDAMRDPANLITMPGADHSVSVAYGVCRTLTTAKTGSGAKPVAVPSQSVGCAAGTYAKGDVITLVAAPGAEQRVQRWIGATQAPAAGVVVNTLTIPNTNSTVTVDYEPCHALTATTLGEGEPLQLGPSATFGCDPGSFVTGQTVTLLATPAAGWRVSSWSGTDDDTATGNTNHVTIPAGASSVTVTYIQTDDPEVPGEGILFLPSVDK
jgi:alpha-tubulin suppressor-like RCC1 family protein